jgi:hypothetical protein
MKMMMPESKKKLLLPLLIKESKNCFRKKVRA